MKRELDLRLDRMALGDVAWLNPDTDPSLQLNILVYNEIGTAHLMALEELEQRWPLEKKHLLNVVHLPEKAPVVQELEKTASVYLAWSGDEYPVLVGVYATQEAAKVALDGALQQGELGNPFKAEVSGRLTRITYLTPRHPRWGQVANSTDHGWEFQWIEEAAVKAIKDGAL